MARVVVERGGVPGWTTRVLAVGLLALALLGAPAFAATPPTSGPPVPTTPVPTTPPAAALTVVHDAHDPADFTYTLTGPAPTIATTDVALDDDSDPERSPSHTFTALVPGTYTLTQRAVAGWKLVAITCSVPAVTDLAARRVTVALAPGSQVTCTFVPALDRPVFGAIRWDAWTDGPPGRAVEYTLGPEQWRSRLPWYARITGPGTVTARADHQAVADREIEIAAGLGVDYFAFLWYDSDRPVGTEDEAMMRGLHLYRRSPLRDRVKYTVIIDGSRLSSARERTAVLALMQDPNWARVDGRPMLFVGLGTAAARADLDALRAASVAQGTGNPYAVYLDLSTADPSRIAGLAATAGADALSRYNVGVTSSQGQPYAQLAGNARKFWDRLAATGAPVVPTAMTGWDPRPRLARPPYWGDSGSNWFQQPTPAELAAHLRDALEWSRQRNARAVIAYAWNEFDEGGWLSPTLVDPDGRQAAIAAALSGRDPPTVSVGPVAVAEGHDGPRVVRVPVTLSRPATDPVTMTYATAGLTADSADFVATSGTVTFVPGETAQGIDVSVIGDRIAEVDESFQVRITQVSGALVQREAARVDLRNDDGEPAVVPVYLSDRTPVSATNGFGPVEQDLSNGSGAARDGGPLRIGGTVYTRGLGTHAPSSITYDLPPRSARFLATVGVDDACNGQGSVVFEVLVDDVVVVTTPRLTWSSSPWPVSVDVTGGTRLTLRATDARDGTACDHADWALARVVTATPTPTTATSTTSTTSTTRPPTTSTSTTTSSSSTTTSSSSTTTTTTTTTSTTTTTTTTTSTTTPPPAPTGTFLSDLKASDARNGFGPAERDMSNGYPDPGDGGPLRVDGVTYAKGLGTHAASELTYRLRPEDRVFTAVVGVDDAAGANGSVTFQVLVDQKVRFTSPVLRGGSAGLAVTVDVRGGRRITLRVTDAQDGATWDWADWADAQLRPGPAPAPTRTVGTSGPTPG